MTDKELFREFREKFNIDTEEFDSFMFGDDADLLAGLVLSGKKTATASLFDLYEIEKEPLPKESSYSVVLNSKEEAVCVIETTKVSFVPFDEVSPEFAAKEGEGDMSLEHWREVHRKFFDNEMWQLGLEFNEKMIVVCEEFKLIYSPKI